MGIQHMDMQNFCEFNLGTQYVPSYPMGEPVYDVQDFVAWDEEANYHLQAAMAIEAV